MPTKLKTTQDFIDGYEKGRAKAIDECIKTIVNTPTKIKIEHYRENDILVDRQNEIIDMLIQLKEQNK